MAKSAIPIPNHLIPPEEPDPFAPTPAEPEPVKPVRTRATGRIVSDPEVLAMASLAEVLDDLEAVTAYRVIQWARDRYYRCVLDAEPAGEHA